MNRFKLRALDKKIKHDPKLIISIPKIVETIRRVVNTKGELYLSDRTLQSILYHIRRGKIERR